MKVRSVGLLGCVFSGWLGKIRSRNLMFLNKQDASLVCKTNQLYSLILSLLLWCSEISKTSQHSFAHVAKSLAQTFSDWFRGSLCVYLVTLTHSDFIRLPVKLMPKENRLLLHIEYWAFHCTDSFSMDWITVKFIGCGVTVCSANTSVFLSFWVKFWLFKNPYYSICVLSCPGHVMGTQRLNCLMLL